MSEGGGCPEILCGFVRCGWYDGRRELTSLGGRWGIESILCVRQAGSARSLLLW